MFSFTPISPVEGFQFPDLPDCSNPLFVKRDDLIHPYVSGNKWRKLKYILKKAQEDQKNHLITFGGAWSNHILATACLCAGYGMRSTAYIRGEEVRNPVLQLCKLFGMELRFTDRARYRDKRGLFEEFHHQDPKALFVDEGGYGELAAKGCQEIVYELTQDYDHIVCGCGTGATVAGIAQAARITQPRARVHGIPVLKGGEFIRESVNALYPDVDNLMLHTEFHFGGYGKTTPALIAFIKKFCSSTGLLIEPVYTGKVFYALQELLENGTILPEEKVLIIHTGGLTGFLGKAQLFD